ncbi:hypothetical protein Tco_0191350 [Tanacetum coccineum]
MVYVVKGVLASGVDMVLEKDFVGFALQEMKIHPLMLLIRTLLMISQTFSPTLHNPSTNHTHASYVGTILTTESTIPLNEITSQIPPSIAITPVLLIKDSKDSLSIGDEHLSTIPKKESDELIKSSVKDLVPIPSESEDTSGSDSDCDLPSDDESLSDEDVLEDNVKIYSNPFFNFDDEYISSDVNPLFDEVLENIKSKDSYVSNLDEPALLVTPLSDANEDECFDPGGDFDEIDAFLDVDISIDIENGYHDSEGDIIYLEILLIDNTIPNLPPKVFLDHDPRNLKDELDINDLYGQSF